ncbi:MAG: flavodoxin [Eubacteriaceae bacterium]|jgi:flavodoxin
MSNSKTLVAYFSCSGTTRKVAGKLAEAADADLFEIKPETAYTSADLNWQDNGSRSTQEKNDPASRPVIADKVKDMASYQTVFVGFPIWWYTFPRIIETFLESYDFSEKTVIPFATSGSSGMGGIDNEIKKLCSSQTSWKPGKRFASSVSEGTLKKWIEGLGL